MTVRSPAGAVCERCEIANRPLARLRGLLGRTELRAGEGIWLRPAASVHTFFMRFAIDIVFLDRADEVVRVAHDVRPWRVAGARRARSVLELRAGEARRRGLTRGVRLTTVP